MLIFFDFLYFSIYKFYSTTSDKSPEFAASAAVSGLQAFNIGTVIMLYQFFLKREMYISKLWAGILIAVLFIINYIRYIRVAKYNHEMIRIKLEQKTEKRQKQIRSVMIIYIGASFLLFLGLAIYFGSKKG